MKNSFRRGTSKVSTNQEIILDIFDMSKIPVDSQKILSKWRKLDVIVCIISITGIILSITEYELSFTENRTHENCEYVSNSTLR